MGADLGSRSKKTTDQTNSNDEFINDMCSAEDLDLILKKKFIKA